MACISNTTSSIERNFLGGSSAHQRAEAVSGVNAATMEAIYRIKRAETVSEVDAATSEPAISFSNAWKLFTYT
jgi:hypothetical protein